MKREDIEKAAWESCVIDNGILNDRLQPYFIDGFKEGAEWYINSVWHNNNIMPNRNIDKYGTGEWVVVKIKNSVVYEYCEVIFDENIYYLGGNRETFTMDEVERWAYIKDLIPNTED